MQYIAFLKITKLHISCQSVLHDTTSYVQIMLIIWIPCTGRGKPGDTYYYSHLTINVFGAVSYSVEVLYVYIYTEAKEKKGGMEKLGHYIMERQAL